MDNVENTGSKNNTPEIEETAPLSCNKSVLMQTAAIDVKTSKGGQSEHLRLLLEYGSHQTYVSQCLAERLHLEVIGE